MTDGILTGAVNMLIDVTDEQIRSARGAGRPLPPPRRRDERSSASGC